MGCRLRVTLLCQLDLFLFCFVLGMCDPSGAALAEHLQRYEGDHAGHDTDDDNHSLRSYNSCEQKARHSDDNDVDVTRGRSPKPSRARPLASSSGSQMRWPCRIIEASEALTQWWNRYHPIVMDFVREYGALLVAFILPFTPRAARRSGYRGESTHVLRALDRLDAGLPGGGRGWAERWMSRPRGCRDSCPRGVIHLEKKVGGVGAAAAAVVVAAASWCSWRRSSPSWAALLFELACGSTLAVNYLAREDGRREARVLEAHLLALEHCLGPFFRRVESCLRMIRCSQALSFGLHLSVPMPPIARMEGRLNPAAVGPGQQSTMALRDLRATLSDVLDGAVAQIDALGAIKSPRDTVTDDSSCSEDPARESHDRQLLAGLVKTEKQISSNLSQFVADLAHRIYEAVVGPDEWGLWWDSKLVGVSEAVRRTMEYFEAASERLEMAMGPGLAPFTALDTSSPGDIAAVAETLSALRLRYEETVVRLYSCQRSVSAILHDAAGNTEEAWETVRHELAGALESTRTGGTDEELWREADRMVDSLANGSFSRETEETSSPVQQEHSPDVSRHLESGVGWVSLTTPRRENPGVFEDGNGEQESEQKPQDLPAAAVTDVLIGVASPGRSRHEGDDSASIHANPAELENERSRSQLLGELGSVLRARPLPPTLEKHLPLESQLSLRSEEQEAEEDKGNQDEVEEEDEKDLGPDGLEDITPSLASPPPEPARSHMPVCENIDGQDLMSELRAQLSMAANEEIFSSDRDHCAVESDAEGESSVLIDLDGHEIVEEAGLSNERG